MEEWAPIEGFENYEVSDEGRIRNENSGHILKQFPNGHDIIQVVMYRDGKNHARAVHKLVAHAFTEVGPEGTVPMHRDGDKRNCRADNLEWKDRWFVHKLTMQRKRTVPRDPRGILMLSTGVVYPNALVCANEINGLEELVLITAQNPHRATYMGSQFEFFKT